MKRTINQTAGTFQSEINRNVKKISIIFLIIYVLLSAGIFQLGIVSNKSARDQKIEFTEVEIKQFDRYVTYAQYGVHGFRLLVEFSPLFTLFQNSTSFADLESFIDSGVKLKISKP